MGYRDYHLHTKFSFDSREEPENTCRKAVELGLEEICFTEHFEFGADDAPWTDIGRWNEEIDRCRELFAGKLIILQGIEAGQPQKEADRAKKLMDSLSYRLDFVIGSIHICGNNGRPSKFGFTKESYKEYFKNYFEDAKELAVTGDFDVMAHLTFPFRYVSEDILREYPIYGFESDFREIFDILISRGKGIEINTSGLRTGLASTMPDEQIVSWYRQQGGQILTIGSDGHSAKSAGSGIVDGYKVAENAGFTGTTAFRGRNLQFVKWTNE